MNAIACVSKSWAIGRDNQLLFHLKEDMRRFRTLTLGGTVILGRRTLDSFPGGKPLPGRRNIVITRDRSFSRPGAESAHSLEDALKLTDPERDDVWIIGGSSVYAAALSRCKRAYLTCVDADAEGADAFFPDLDRLPGWTAEETSAPVEENGVAYRFVTYRNQNL